MLNYMMKSTQILIVGGALLLSACSTAMHKSDPATPAKPAYTVMSVVHFATRSSVIDSSAKAILSKAAATLSAQEKLQVEIAGHADSRNTDAFNMALSKRRAEGVFRYLVSHGIRPDRLTIRAYGESKPVASNETKAGMAKNRRVELRTH